MREKAVETRAKQGLTKKRAMIMILAIVYSCYVFYKLLP